MEPSGTPAVFAHQHELGWATAGELRNSAQVYSHNENRYRLASARLFGQHLLSNQAETIRRTKGANQFAPAACSAEVELHNRTEEHRLIKR